VHQGALDEFARLDDDLGNFVFRRVPGALGHRRIVGWKGEGSPSGVALLDRLSRLHAPIETPQI
jgi:hypothetical protein